jgi:hypothetical protein
MRAQAVIGPSARYARPGSTNGEDRDLSVGVVGIAIGLAVSSLAATNHLLDRVRLRRAQRA